MNEIIIAFMIFNTVMLSKIIHYNFHLNQKLKRIMATIEQFRASFAQINTATSNIADDIRRLTEQLGQSGASAADEDAALAELNTIAASLDAIAATTPEDPTPPTGESKKK